MATLNFVRELGSGNFGTTYLAETKNGTYAVKAIDVQNAQRMGLNINQILEEAEVLSKISKSPRCHPFIACYYKSQRDIFNGRDTIFIISEFIDGPTLNQNIITRSILSQPFEPNPLWTYMYQLTSGLYYIHRMGFAHRDIKPENIMFDKNSKRYKFIDFGLACNVNCTEMVGTPEFLPPEIVLGVSPRTLASSQAHDVWSLGVVFYMMANLRLPFKIPPGKGDDYNEVMKAIIRPIIPSNYTYPFNFKRDKVINYMINAMLNHNWKIRPTTQMLMEYMNNEIQKIGFKI